MRTMIKSALLLFVWQVAGAFYESYACTRVMYKGLNDLILTARSMDWKEDIYPNLWIFPRGMSRSGEAGPNSLKWKSKYGSVVASAYDFCSTDGMNEKGLVANLLWLAESEYPAYDGKKPGLTIAAWIQYVLDNYATVTDVVKELEQEKFIVVSDKVPGEDRMANLHMSVSDPSGDNAIFEYVKGKLIIHHDKRYQVMTNSPVFDKQLALNEYWHDIGGTVMLPGTNRAADRFVRASFYTEAIPKTDNTHIAVASVFSVIRNCSVPYGITTPDQPNISSTRWRSVSDQKNLVYYFETVLTPNTFWVNLKDIDFSEKAAVKRLGLSKGEVYAGNAAAAFKDSQPFKFLGLQ
ncbi:linear amide C-N hydrolase [Paraflavitalea sp. CAU 1676]|uniref:linear amide C-N hydrolase n=1 Tax=Paraflavitalea sp. CAU 1676 TaxID=3032598 RepID=UPI0023DC4C2B|nr:linear amide C-N hydrolase [Paraflavitalea sp. CAU 1676]MDF2191859.1 linear amide C-N hydrolase [Paraflavitalea sp. CAU 1676]